VFNIGNENFAEILIVLNMTKVLYTCEKRLWTKGNRVKDVTQETGR